MWTDTHYYCFPQEALEAPSTAAVDVVGVWNEQTHVNVRWWGEEPTEWAPFRVYPENPKRVFA